jgi:hypothetical protein
MADTYTTTITFPPNLLAMLRQEAQETGNSLSSIIRRRVLDSYRREAADLGAVFYPDPPDEEPEPVSE